ncbi:MAG: thiol:disulfide interchange protein DsbA/DsbL [Xanthomonadales bacterium]|nr:thiol:disulfide interchange protein DsbA/DsbL [Xanthomonadales bacterium]
MSRNVVFKTLFFAAALLLAANTANAQSAPKYQEGLHYFLIDSAAAMKADKIELAEFFSYLCTHCNTFDPYIENWKQRKPDYVEFRRIPVVFGRGSWELYARGYVTADMMGVAEQAHAPLMDELWDKKNVLRTMDELAAFYSQFGIDQERFLATSRSFAVDGRMRKEQRMAADFGIQGTPSLVLSGKYRIAGSAAVPSYDVMLDVVNFLIEKEAAALQSADASAEAREGRENEGA